MALQDLTPQLRTRLRRVERAVGWFIMLAAILMLAGTGYYVYSTAQRKGWFLDKVEYYTCLSDASGIKVGDPVRLMGFNVGEITKIAPNEPHEYYNLTVYFRVRSPYYGYLLIDSKVKLAASDFLGNRHLELIKGKGEIETVLIEKKVSHTIYTRTNDVIVGILDKKVIDGLRDKKKDPKALLAIYADEKQRASLYAPVSENRPWWIEAEENPSLTDELGVLVTQVKDALPGFFALTNQLETVLDNTTKLTENLNTTVTDLQPVIENATTITGMLTNGPGALGDYLIPTNIAAALELVLGNASGTLTNANGTISNATTTLLSVQANLDKLISNVVPTLENLAAMTGNLRGQLERNGNMLSGLNNTIIHADDMLQGLKHHWLLRSAFKTNAPPKSKSTTPSTPARSPRGR